MDDLANGQNLTAAQAHLIVGEVLDRITIPRATKKHFKRAAEVAERPEDDARKSETAVR